MAKGKGEAEYFKAPQRHAPLRRSFENFDAHLICPPPHQIKSKSVADIFQKYNIEYSVFQKI